MKTKNAETKKKKKKSTDESEKGWKMLMGSKRTAEVL